MRDVERLGITLELVRFLVWAPFSCVWYVLRLIAESDSGNGLGPAACCNAGALDPLRKGGVGQPEAVPLTVRSFSQNHAQHGNARSLTTGVFAIDSRSARLLEFVVDADAGEVTFGAHTFAIATEPEGCRRAHGRERQSVSAQVVVQVLGLDRHGA